MAENTMKQLRKAKETKNSDADLPVIKTGRQNNRQASSKDTEIMNGLIAATVQPNLDKSLEKSVDLVSPAVIPFRSGNCHAGSMIGNTVSIDEARTSMVALQRFVHEVLIENVDYAKIDGYERPSLMLSGAQKIASSILKVSHRQEIVNRIEDYNKPFFCYETKVTLVDITNGIIKSEAHATCNSREARFRDMDPYTVANVAIKLSLKRSFVTAVLYCGNGLSSFFTCDLEEWTNNSVNKVDSSIINEKPMSQRQYVYICDLIKMNNIMNEEFRAVLKELFNLDDVNMCNSQQASKLIERIKQM